MSETTIPKTHDYTRREWGHNYTITQVMDKGQHLEACGWGFGIEEGDYLLLRNGEQGTRYRVASIGYYCDPPDMWWAALSFAPRQAEVDALKDASSRQPDTTEDRDDG